jgi:hypothetical protein
MGSNNSKTGPMLVTTSNDKTCPDACPLKAGGCYAKHGPLGYIWRGLSSVDPGEKFKNGRSFITALSFDEMLDRVRALPLGSIWRKNQAGDLPGDGKKIDRGKLAAIVEANVGRKGFTYTHYEPTKHNLDAIRQANASGFTINLSADTLEEADNLAATGAGPVVTVLPKDQRENLTTPHGRTVVVCPAYTQNLTCVQCQLCQKQRSTIVGFPAHGAGAKRAERVYKEQEEAA